MATALQQAMAASHGLQACKSHCQRASATIIRAAMLPYISGTFGPDGQTRQRGSLGRFSTSQSPKPYYLEHGRLADAGRPKPLSAALSRAGRNSSLSRFVQSRFCSAHIRADKLAKMTDRNILPDNVKPTHYTVSLRDMDFTNWVYKGTVTIDSTIVKPTKEIVINTLELKVTNTKVSIDQTKSTQTWESTTVSYDAPAQRATITFDQEIPVSNKAVVTIEFEGIINNEMCGFYRSKYKPAETPVASVPRDENYHYMISTQFESTDARRAFPCFDEPNLKATFDFDIEIPIDQVALSNMPVKETKPSKEGWHVVYFDRTPIMSSYLLAWAVGDFEYVEDFTERHYNGKQIPVRVYTTRGLKEQGRFALEHAPKTIDYFSTIFDIDYPLPKADLLCVHEFSHGAMENWGLVTYRTTRVLYDEKTSSPQLKNDIAYVVAHELAHQWFGNLVTMDWWDELWLNEGFATWVGWLAVDHIHPDWQVWAQFVSEGMEMAFTLDGIRASHPIHVPVRDALDVNQIFDHISYLKGCSSIRMLANHLGVETFLKGVSNYLKAHAYGNAKTTALWDALSVASGKDVNEIMSPWISKIGHPVVTIEEKPNQISVKQSRFLSTGDVKAEDDETTWWVPLGIQGKKDEAGVAAVSLLQREETITDVDSDFYQVNANATGFYRVNYPAERLAKLTTQLDKLSIEDRIAIIGSTAALAFAGNTTSSALLTFLQGLSKESHPVVWDSILNALATLSSVFGGDAEISKSLKNFTLKLITEKANELGWDAQEGEHYRVSLLRGRMLGSAISNGDVEITKAAVSRFNAWAENAQANPISPPLRKAVYRAGLLDRPAAAVEILKNEWRTTTVVDGKETVVGVLGHTGDLEVVKSDVLSFLFNTSPPNSSVDSFDMMFMGLTLAENHVARPAVWEHMQNNWETTVAKLGNPTLIERFVGIALKKFSDVSVIEQINTFFQDKDIKAFDRTLETAKDHIIGRAAYKARDAAALKQWLTSNGY